MGDNASTLKTCLSINLTKTLLENNKSYKYRVNLFRYQIVIRLFNKNL
jgi:hypothetical protein